MSDRERFAQAVDRHHFYPELAVSPEKDFIPISIAAETPGIFVASSKYAPNSAKEMVADVKANPGKVNYASAGISTLTTTVSARRAGASPWIGAAGGAGYTGSRPDGSHGNPAWARLLIPRSMPTAITRSAGTSAA